MIYFLNDMPFALAFGGKEMQLETYHSILINRNAPVQKMNFWEKNVTIPGAGYHLFGSGKWYHSVVSQIHANYDPQKIIISPNFYFLPSAKLTLASRIVKLLPYKSDFFFKEYIFNKADVIVANSHSEKHLLASLFGRELKNKTIVIPNVIPNDFDTIQNEVDIFKLYGLSEGYILSVGLLDERKNSVSMLEGFLKTSKYHNKKLVIVGKYRFNVRANYYRAKKIIEENNDRILHIQNLIPNSDLIKSLYKYCDVHFLPSFVETPGISNLEALAFGKKLVVGDCPPVKEYFKDYANYCNPSSLNSIANTLAHAIKLNSLPGNIQYVKDNFLVSSISKKVLSLYEL